jgi:hypothetical protein
MKKVIAFTVLIFLSIWSSGTSSAGIVGDINSDGKIDLTEAIYALQVTMGVYPDLNVSCSLVGKGVWATGTNYLSCDVVVHDGLYYACIESHTSAEPKAPPDASVWSALVLGDITHRP